MFQDYFRYLLILIESNLLSQYTSCGEAFCLLGQVNHVRAPTQTPAIRIYLGIRAYNKLKMPNLFMGVNLY